MSGLATILAPRSIAVIGASNDPGKLSGRPVANFQRFGFTGRIYPVNPRNDTVLGLRSYGSIDRIDAPVDLALIMTPAATTVDFVQQGLAAGIKNFIVYAAGFAEFNEEGALLQRRLADLVADGGATLIGPNCTGVINSEANLCATFATVVDQIDLQAGGASFVGQSGAMAAYWLEMTRRAGLGFAKWISTGNEADVSLADAITYLASDDATQYICTYIEGTRDGVALCQAFQTALAAGKPVLALRAGKSAAGASATASHTGAIAGEGAVWEALFLQTGVIECGSLSEMLNVMKLLERRPARAAERPLIMSISGGAGALTTDALAEKAVEIRALPAEVAERVGAVVPNLGNLGNPLDLTGALASDSSLFTGAAKAVVDADEFDSFVIFLGLMDRAKDEIAEAIDTILIRSGKPVLLIWMGASAAVAEALHRRQIPFYDDIPQAVMALTAWNRWHRAFLRRENQAVSFPSAYRADGQTLSEYNGQRRLGTLAGIRWPEAVLLRTGTLAGAELPPWPLVAKIQSGQMPHKSEHGGVVVGIRDSEVLAAEVERMFAIVDGMDIQMDGILVQEMVPHEHELFVGIRRDPVFGPILALGRGGTEVEFESDVCIRLLPLSADDIRTMIEGLRYASRLRGVRGRPGVDLDRLSSAIAELCRRYEADRDLIEIEINPLAVSSDDACVALDLLVCAAPSRP